MAIKLILAVFAVYGLAQMVVFDSGPLRIFDRIHALSKDWADRYGWTNLDDGLNCPYCLGVYFSILVAILVLYPTWPGDIILFWFGIAGAQSWLESRKTRL